MSSGFQLKKITAAIARAQDGNVVDLARIESDARTAVLQWAIERVWQAFGAELIEADAAEQMLRRLEEKVFVELLRPPSIAECRAAQPAAHRAARGVKKVRGAK